MKHLIAIDIGSALTKVIEVLAHKGGYELLTLNSFSTPFNGAQLNDELFFEQLTKYVPLSRLKTSVVAISVPVSATSFTFIDLPKMPQDELLQVIIREAKRKIFPVPHDKDIIQSILVSEIKMKDEIQEHRLIGAASQEVIMKYTEIFTSRGIIPQLVGSSPLALMQDNFETQSGTLKNLAFIDIGHKHTSIAVFKQNEVALIRSIPFACFNFIESASKKLKITYDEAKELFLKEGVKDEDLADSWDYLLAELRRSFTYYKDITGGSRIDGMVFCGGMMTFKKSAEYIRHSIGGDLEIFELKSSRSLTTERFTPADLITRGPLFATAYGILSMLKAQKIPVINFVPSEILRQVKSKRLNFLSVNVLVSTMIILALANIGVGVNSIFIKRRLANLKSFSRNNDFSYITKQASEIDALTAKLAQDKKVVDALSRNEPPLEKIFTLLSGSVSPSTYISKITIDYKEKDDQTKPQILNPKDSIFSPAKEQSQDAETPALGEVKKQKGSQIVVKIKGYIVSDYESAQKELNAFCKRFADSGIFSELNSEKLKVEEIVIAANGQGQELTNVKAREFVVEGRIDIK